MCLCLLQFENRNLISPDSPKIKKLALATNKQFAKKPILNVAFGNCLIIITNTDILSVKGFVEFRDVTKVSNYKNH